MKEPNGRKTMLQMPTIKIELDHMRQGIVAALSDYNSQLSEHVNTELQNAIDTFDFEGTVRELAREAVKEAVSKSVVAFFTWGDGYKLIDSMVKESLLKVVQAGKPDDE